MLTSVQADVAAVWTMASVWGRSAPRARSTVTVWKRRAVVGHRNLKPGERVLDIGCAKGFQLGDFVLALPWLEVARSAEIFERMLP